MFARSKLQALLCVLLLLFCSATAQSAHLELRDQLCWGTSPSGPPPTPDALAGSPFECGEPARDYAGQWLWLRVDDPARLRDLPANWHLLVDQTRFTRVAVLAVASDGTSDLMLRDPGALRDNWALGGALRFDIERPGADLRELYLGFEHLPALSLMRRVTAVSPDALWSMQAPWLVLMGLFTGALLCAFAYNLLIYTGQRYAFQRWYLLWVAAALTYGLIWTNAAAFFVPGLVGPAAVRANCVLLGMIVGAGNLFLLAVLEEGMLPSWVRITTKFFSGAGALLGLAAAADWLFPAASTDRWMNYALLGAAISSFIGVCFAIRRGSRIVWFYLVGWTPVICVFALRLARNFEFLAQDDRVDMATFAAITFESVALSLAIADRFRLLRRERDSAEQARRAIEVEKETLQRAAHTDFLTQLGNRAAFHADFRALVNSGTRFDLCLIDVDHLKEINNQLGHDGGDALLAHVAGRLAGAVGGAAKIARIGGDEFALLLPVQGGDHCWGAALDSLQGETWSFVGQAWPVSLSIGWARFPADGATAEQLYKNADLALYEAKALGRGRTHRYDTGLRASLERKLALAREAQDGLRNDEFELHYQPIFDLATGTAASVEALLRWRHPRHGLITPGAFRHVLVDEQVGPLLHDRVLTLAIRELRAHGAGAPIIALNLTAAQLRGTRAAERILHRLAASGVEPGQLCIEVVEEVMLDQSAGRTIAALEALKAAGVRIALDDFGTGYASLIHLKQMPVDVLKIDRSFIGGLFDDGGQSQEIVRAIIAMARGLQKTVVAEGVETEEQAIWLRAVGCDMAQGYLFAPPQPLLTGQALKRLIAAA